MKKRGFTKSFRQKKVPKSIHPHVNHKNSPPPLQPAINSSFDKQENKKYPPIKPIFIIRKRNTSLINPDMKNKQNKDSIDYESKKEGSFLPQSQMPFQSTKINFIDKKNHWLKQNNGLYKTESKQINSVMDKDDRTHSVRSKNKSKNKKIHQCKIRKVNWGHGTPFEIGVSRIIETEKGQNQMESLQQLYGLIGEGKK